MLKDSRILIVDDTPANLEFIGSILKNAGCEIYLAEAGDEALELIPKIIPDLILLDIMMPEMDGFEVCEQLQRSPHHATPILFLSAMTDTQSIVKGLELGAVDYITKPAKPGEVLARVRNHLGLARARADQQSFTHILSSNIANPLRHIEQDIQECDARNYATIAESVLDWSHHGLALLSSMDELMNINSQGVVCTEINVNEALLDALDLHQAQIDRLKLKINIHVDDQLQVLADYMPLVSGILGNSIGFCLRRCPAESSITIEAKPQNKHVELIISDAGPTIPSSMARQLLYPQIDLDHTRRDSTEQNFDHSLAVVRRFLQAMRGDIQIAPRRDQANPVIVCTLPSPTSSASNPLPPSPEYRP